MLLNQGDGTFVTQLAYAAGGGPSPVVPRDLDGDGDLYLAIAISEESAVLVLVGITPAPNTPVLTSPNNGSSTCEATPTFEWLPLQGAISSQIQADNNHSFSSPAINVTTSDPGFTAISALAPVTYNWHVRAANYCGEGIWSSIWHFERLACLYLLLVMREN